MLKYFTPSAILIALCCLSLFACNPPQKPNASIIGYDFTKCGCCHGYQIMVGQKIFLYDETPNILAIPLPPDSVANKQPISCFVDFTILQQGCKNKIKINSINLF